MLLEGHLQIPLKGWGMVIIVTNCYKNIGYVQAKAVFLLTKANFMN